MLAAAVAAFGLGGAGACRRPAFHGPHRVLQGVTESGARPRLATLALEGDARPALLETARFRVPVPARGLLTLGLGVAVAPGLEPPGWFRASVSADGRVLAERTLNPRALRGWRDISVPLDGLSREAVLELDLRLADREGRPLAVPPGLTLAMADPVIHDLDAYGRAKGVVLVSIDTLRRDHVGIYGYAPPTTPRLDGLGRAGLVAEDATSTSSWTLPAHLSMLTSTDPGRHGGVDMRHGYDGRVPSLARLLREKGYATRAITSHLYVSAVYGLDQGFDHLDFHQDRRAPDVASRAIDAIDRFGDRPFFLFLHFYDPHWHYDPPASTLALFAKPYQGALTGVWSDFSKRDRSTVTDADLAHLLALYDGEIRHTDDELGRVLDHIAARGLGDSTLLVVTSDHGEEFLEHGSWEHQKTLYEEVVRIPLIVRAPGVAPRREPSPVSLLDVAPTVLAWAGIPAPPSFQGRDLLARPGDREGYGETDHTVDGTHKLFLRAGQGRWKAILSLAKGGGAVAKEEWFDLASDAGERRSVPPRADAADAIRTRAVERWRAGRAGAGAGRPVCLTAEQRERLRALGYVDAGHASCTPEAPR